MAHVKSEFEIIEEIVVFLTLFLLTHRHLPQQVVEVVRLLLLLDAQHGVEVQLVSLRQVYLGGWFIDGDLLLRAVGGDVGGLCDIFSLFIDVEFLLGTLAE
jgi:hypothetical protein